MKDLAIVTGIVILSILALFGVGFVAGSYKLKSEIDANKYVDVIEIQNLAPLSVERAMQDGIITYSEYYSIVDDAKRNMITLAKMKIILQKPQSEIKGLIKLKESEGLLND